jgi:hypothetical protein
VSAAESGVLCSELDRYLDIDDLDSATCDRTLQSGGKRCTSRAKLTDSEATLPDKDVA